MIEQINKLVNSMNAPDNWKYASGDEEQVSKYLPKHLVRRKGD